MRRFCIRAVVAIMVPHDIVYVVACGSDGERDLREITESLEILAREG